MTEHIIKACPRCGQPLEIKRNRQTNEEFVGCTAYRETGCGYTEPLPEHIKLRRAGQQGLFDTLDEEDSHAQSS